jgi:hypothetical protein
VSRLFAAGRIPPRGVQFVEPDRIAVYRTLDATHVKLILLAPESPEPAVTVTMDGKEFWLRSVDVINEDVPESELRVANRVRRGRVHAFAEGLS